MANYPQLSLLPLLFWSIVDILVTLQRPKCPEAVDESPLDLNFHDVSPLY